MKKNNTNTSKENAGHILGISIEDVMQSSYIDYAMSVIVDRALPDVRDGLKPVHRRILYAMNELHLEVDKPFRKSARIVGDVLGKYHPHGDSSVYDAMVRLAQDFSMRYPLVWGQGNFGSVDGDGAAAMRYTEAKMTGITHELLTDLQNDTVDFQPNFDGSEQEPSVLPSGFPNLLVNGTSGIAVGMASSVPPHNLGEAIDATIAVINKKTITVDDIMAIMPGPDFPTGAIINGNAEIKKAYETGKGKIRVRATLTTEPAQRGKTEIIITEIPYMCNKSKLVERIAYVAKEVKVGAGISDVRDESGRDGIRIIVEIKKGANVDKIMAALYKYSDLETTFGYNMLALVNGQPKQLGILEYLNHFISFKRETTTRKMQHILKQIVDRIEILEGLVKILDDIDHAISIIRSSQTVTEAKVGLIDAFSINDRQAQAVLDMRLQRLTGMEKERLEKELTEKIKERDRLMAILASPKKIDTEIKKDLRAIKKKYNDERRTEIMRQAQAIKVEHTVEKKPIAVEITDAGYIGAGDVERPSVVNSRRDDDIVQYRLIGTTHDYLIIFTADGSIHKRQLLDMDIEVGPRKASPFVASEYPQIDTQIVAAMLMPSQAKAGLIMVTANGRIKRMNADDISGIGRQCVTGIKLKDNDEVVAVFPYNGDDSVIVMVTNQGDALACPSHTVNPMHRNAAGVTGMKLGPNQKIVDAFALMKEGFYVATQKGRIKHIPVKNLVVQGRGGKGRSIFKRLTSTGDIVGAGTLLAIDHGDGVTPISSLGINPTKMHQKSGTGLFKVCERVLVLETPDSNQSTFRVIEEKVLNELEAQGQIGFLKHSDE